MISKELEEFINQYIDLIDQNRFEALFEEARSLLSNVARAELVNMLQDAEIPFLSHMRFINHNLFYSSPITYIELPENIRQIGKYAFANSALHSIKINDGCQTIDTSAFVRCAYLRDVSLPNSLISIGRGAFANCIKLENVEYRGTTEEWSKIKFNPMWLSLAGIKVLTIKCLNGDVVVNSSIDG